MSRASVTTFGRGVSFVASGETGTQANEFEAAIKSVTSSTTVGAVFVYDTRNDSDSGAWRKKAKGSWYYEDLNTATRGGRREFPSVALIVADTASGSETVTIYDLDDVAAPMWLVFQMGGASESSRNFSGRAGENANSLFALNGRVMWGINADLSSGGVCIADFANDAGRRHGTLASYTETGRVLSERNSAILPQRMVGGLIVNGTVNDVAATVLEGAEIGALGLPIPTVAVACGTGGSNGGISVIHANESVYDIAEDGTCDSPQSVSFDGDKIVGVWNTVGATNRHAYIHSVPFADQGADDSPLVDYGDLTTSADLNYGHTGVANTVTATAKNSCAYGSNSGLTLFKNNYSNPSEGASAHITSTYNSGMMLGDIRFAGLAGSGNAGQDVADRSVKANTLTKSGSITSTAVATSAELHAYSGFSTSNHLSRAYDADFDFGTGDFSICFWTKFTANGSTSQVFIDRRNSDNTGAGILIYDPSSQGKFQLYVIDSSSSNASITTTNTYNDDNWHQVFAMRRSSKLYVYVDGVDAQTSHSASTQDLDNGTGQLRIGAANTTTSPLSNGSLSLVRISATAPTPQQVADIYEAEKPLFRAGAKCLLGSNTVRTMAYDKSTDVLYVSDAGGYLNHFRGLEVVQQDDDSTDTVVREHRPFGSASAAGGIVAQYAVDSPSSISAAALGVSLPPFDVRGDTNIADTKSSDDGKIRFTGVTTDATPTVIGNIPIAENERYTVRAKVVGQVYNDNDNSYIDVVEEKIFFREAGSDIGGRASSYKMTDANHNSFDVELVQTTGGSDSPASITSASNLIMIKVTGKSASPSRIVWNATVEVQRITERSYER